MEKILISACLLGEKCTYKGGDNKASYIEELNQYFDLVPFCPEVEGGLPTPRAPSEIRGSSVYREDGTDVTKAFHLGAYKATSICSFLGIRLAILKENSPSCGVHKVHNGYFNDVLVSGEGMTTRALRKMGVTVLNEEEGLAMLEELKKQNAIKDEKTERAKEAEAAKSAPKQEPEEERPHFKPRPIRPYQGKTRPFGKKEGFPGKKSHGEKRDEEGIEKKPRFHGDKPFKGKGSFKGKGKPFDKGAKNRGKPRGHLKPDKD